MLAEKLMERLPRRQESAGSPRSRARLRGGDDGVMAGVNRDDESIEGELLDLGVVGERTSAAGEPRVKPGMSRRGLLLTGGVLAAGGLAVALSPRSSSPPPSAGKAPPSSPASASRAQPGKLTRPLPGTRPGWELCALGANVLLRIHPATGLVVPSPVPRVGDGQVSLVPLRRGVLLRPVGPGPGYLVPDGGRTVVLSPELAGDGPVLPGPDQDHVWTVRQQGGAEMALVDVGTGRTRVAVPVPKFSTTGPMTDGAGGLLFEGVGGLYRVSPAGELRISNGIILAVGSGTLLTLELNPRGRWQTVLRPQNGNGRVVPIPIGPQLPHGVLSPDGDTVALFVVHEPTGLTHTSRIGLALVGLRSGLLRSVDVDLTGVAGDGSLAWSPDGRWVFCVDATNGLAAVDVSSGAVSLLDPHLPPVTQLAIRMGS